MPVTTRSRGNTPRKPTAGAAPTKEHTPSNVSSPPEIPSTVMRTMSTSSKPSPYYLLIYAAILAAGSLYSQISPSATTAAANISPPRPLAPGISSDLNTPYTPPLLPSPSYFAGKSNLINLYFVKIGWFWTTLAFALLQATTTRRRQGQKPSTTTSLASKESIQALTRYALITLSWILTTQWFFGPPLIDRSFTITGGHCEAPPLHLLRSSTTSATAASSTSSATLDITTLTSSIACKAAGGRWRGGHDISGHVFMLVLSSAFLLLELALADSQSAHPRVSDRAAVGVARDLAEADRDAIGGWESERVAKLRIWVRWFLWGVVGLDVWMLMMTAIWFHTWLEKVSGLVIAVGTLYGVYWGGELSPAWGAVVGRF